jgi:hypothetical protein
VIDVTDRAHVHVRLGAVKLFLRHGSSLSPNSPVFLRAIGIELSNLVVPIFDH